MEREKRGREKREGRREGRGGGGEMRKMKRIVGIMMIMMMMGCGQQTEVAGGGKSLSEVLLEVGRSTEKAFYTFLELVSDTLGFRVTTGTKRSDVGSYFSSLGTKLGQAATELEEVVKKAAVDGNKDGILNKTIKEAVDAAKATLNVLKGHLDSLGTVGDGNVVGDASSNAAGVAASTDELKASYKALKGIVEVAKKEGVESSEVGTTTLKVGGVDNKDGAKILGIDQAATATDAAKSALIVSAVRGEEMLDSIVKSGEGDAAVGTSNATASSTAISFAKGGNAANVSGSADAKASAVAGGIALRSLVKSGKLAAATANQQGGQGEVQAVGVAAANKLLIAVEGLIKKTVKNILDKTKTKIDEARKPKTAE